MNTFKRLCITVNAHINALIDQVENHEAVAEAAMVDIQDALGNATYELKRLQAEKKQMETKLTALRADEGKWKERAVKENETDPARALECVRRLKRAQDEIASLGQQLSEHAKLEKSMAADVREIENRFAELKRRRSQLAARSSRAEALQSLSEQSDQAVLGGAFDRWERSILRSEVEAGLSQNQQASTDEFADEMAKADEEAELAEMLKELVKKPQA